MGNSCGSESATKIEGQSQSANATTDRATTSDEKAPPSKPKAAWGKNWSSDDWMKWGKSTRDWTKQDWDEFADDKKKWSKAEWQEWFKSQKWMSNCNTEEWANERKNWTKKDWEKWGMDKFGLSEEKRNWTKQDWEKWGVETFGVSEEKKNWTKQDWKKWGEEKFGHKTKEDWEKWGKEKFGHCSSESATKTEVASQSANATTDQATTSGENAPPGHCSSKSATKVEVVSQSANATTDQATTSGENAPPGQKTKQDLWGKAKFGSLNRKSTSSKPKLTYFGLRGRAEGARILLKLAEVDFEDCRITNEEWPAFKPTTPFGYMPILEIDGKQLVQCKAIYRYLAKQYAATSAFVSGVVTRLDLDFDLTKAEVAAENFGGFYPDNNLDCADVDAIVDMMDDLRKGQLLNNIFSAPGPREKETALEDFRENVTKVLGNLEKKLLQHNEGNGFFVGDKMTVADVLLNCEYDFVHSIGEDRRITDDFRVLTALRDRVAQHDIIKAWREARPATHM